MILIDQLQQLNQLNETKGSEQSVLNKALLFRQEAEAQSDWSMVAQSYWQEHLAHQHLVMNGLDSDGLHRQQMLSTALSGHQIVSEHSLNDLLGTSHRFLGRAYTYNNQHQEAHHNYQTAINLLKAAQDPRYLEVSGFLCESLVRTGQISIGLNQAYQLFDSYDTDPLAQGLKKADEYKFFVWRTGIFPRLTLTLDELKIDYDKTKLRQYLEKSQRLLNNDTKYSYRQSEISRAVSLLGILLASHLPFISHLGHLSRL